MILLLDLCLETDFCSGDHKPSTQNNIKEHTLDGIFLSNKKGTNYWHTSRALCWVKKANLKKSCTIWFHFITFSKWQNSIKMENSLMVTRCQGLGNNRKRMAIKECLCGDGNLHRWWKDRTVYTRCTRPRFPVDFSTIFAPDRESIIISKG